MITTISCVFLPAVKKRLHSTVIIICTSGGDPLLLSPLLKNTTHCLTVLTFTVWSPQMSKNVNGCNSFLHGGIQCHTFASPTLPRQTSLCQIAPLLPSVTQQQHGMENWWEGSASTAIPPTPTSDTVGQHNKIGDITFRAALVLLSTPT